MYPVLSAFKNKTNSNRHESRVVNTGKNRMDNAKSLKVNIQCDPYGKVRFLERTLP